LESQHITGFPMLMLSVVTDSTEPFGLISFVMGVKRYWGRIMIRTGYFRVSDWTLAIAFPTFSKSDFLEVFAG